MIDFICISLATMWEMMIKDSLSLLTVMVCVVWFYLLSSFWHKVKSYMDGKVFLKLIDDGDLHNANMFLAKQGRYLIMPPPAFLGVKGMGDNFSEALLEFSHGYSCNFSNRNYSGQLDPLVFGISLNEEQALALKQAMEEFLKLHKEGKAAVKVSPDKKIIDIKNMFTKKDESNYD